MKKLFAPLLAALLLIVGAASVFADPAHSTKVVTLLSSTGMSKTTGAKTLGSAINTNFRYNSASGLLNGFSRHMMVFLDVTAVSGATEDLTIEGRATPASAWATLSPATSWTQITTATGSQARRYDGPIPPEIRAVFTTGSGTGTSKATASVLAVIGG